MVCFRVVFDAFTSQAAFAFLTLYYYIYTAVVYVVCPLKLKKWKNKKNEANFHTAKESTLFCQGDEGVGTGHRL